MGKEDCETCGERVFLMERLSVENHVLHRACFKCSTCNSQLKPGSYEYEKNTDKFYCRAHYREVLRQQTLKRTMEARGITSFEEKDKDGGTARKRKKKFSSPEPAEPAVSVEVSAPKSSAVASITASGSKPAAPPLQETSIAEEPMAEQPSQISRQASEKLKNDLPSLLKTLAATKQKEAQNKKLSSPPPPSIGSLSAGNSPVSTPLGARKTDQPAVVTHTSPSKTKLQLQSGKGTVVMSAKANGLPKSVPAARDPSPPANAQPDTKGLPKSTVSWLTKGAKVVPKTEPTPRPLPRTSGSEAPERAKQPSRPPPPSVSKTSRTTSAAGAPPPPLIVKQISTPVIRSVTQVTQIRDTSKIAPVPSHPEIPKPAKKDELNEKEAEKTVSFEALVSTPTGAPVKPPRTKSKKNPSPDKPKEAEKPQEQLSDKDKKPEERLPERKPEERLPERKPEDKPPTRQSIRPKRPAPPRPMHAPSIRKAGHSPSRVPPVGKSKCVCVCGT